MRGEPTILLLTGNMCDERMWAATRAALRGRELAVRVPAESSIEAMAEACLGAHPGTLVPIGFSMGAIVALAMADVAPDRIAALGLIDANPGSDRPERAAVRRRQQRDVLDGNLERVVSEELKPAYLAEANRPDEALLALILDMALGLGPDVFVAQSEALRTRGDYRHVLGSLDVPLFLACGEEDELCPPELHREMAQSAAHAELHVVEGAGHMLPLEQPDALNAELSAWLTPILGDPTCRTAS